MVRSSRRVIVLADATKLNRAGFAEVAVTDQLDVLITDSRADSAVLREFTARGVEVQVVAAHREEQTG